MNFKKIILLNRRQLRENYKTYGVGLLAMTGMLLFLFLVVWHWRDSFSGAAHNGIFLIGLFAGGCMFGTTLFKELKHPARGMWFIGLPASATEKVVLAIVYATIVYEITYVSLFYLTEGIFLWLVKQDNGAMERLDFFKNDFYDFLFTFVNFQLLILWGSLVFKRAALLKTILLMLVIFSISYNANNYLLQMMTGEKSIDGGTIYNYFQFSYAGENVYVYLPYTTQLVVTIFFNYLLPVILSYIIFLKFRETEL